MTIVACMSANDHKLIDVIAHKSVVWAQGKR